MSRFHIDRERIFELAAKGLSANQIAERIGKTGEGVRGVLRRAGWRSPHEYNGSWGRPVVKHD